MNYKRIIELSYALAGRRRHYQRCRHFSFIFNKNKLLSVGLNNPKTHPINLKYNYIDRENNKISEIVSTHSEVSAVIKLGAKYCDGLVIVNTRINRRNEIDYSFPCNGCMEMLKKLRFSKIIYTDRCKNFVHFNS